MKRLIAVALIICIVALFSIGCDSSTSAVRVEYELTGTASKVSVTLNNATGGTEQFSDVYIPHTYTFEKYTDWFLYVSAQNLGDSGSITVTIYLNGEVVATSTSSGAYVIADASYSRL